LVPHGFTEAPEGSARRLVMLLLSNGAEIHVRSNNGKTCLGSSDHRIRSILKKWPISMAIIILQELGLYYLIDAASLIDLYQYLGILQDDGEGFQYLGIPSTHYTLHNNNNNASAGIVASHVVDDN
jgi:hypothetical protein